MALGDCRSFQAFVTSGVFLRQTRINSVAAESRHEAGGCCLATWLGGASRQGSRFRLVRSTMIASDVLLRFLSFGNHRQ